MAVNRIPMDLAREMKSKELGWAERSQRLNDSKRTEITLSFPRPEGGHQSKTSILFTIYFWCCTSLFLPRVPELITVRSWEAEEVLWGSRPLQSYDYPTSTSSTTMLHIMVALPTYRARQTWITSKVWGETTKVVDKKRPGGLTLRSILPSPAHNMMEYAIGENEAWDYYTQIDALSLVIVDQGKGRPRCSYSLARVPQDPYTLPRFYGAWWTHILWPYKKSNFAVENHHCLILSSLSRIK